MCGVFGIYAPGEDVARLAYFGILALQHRGQESAGIATSDSSEIRLIKHAGRIDRFTESEIEELSGSSFRPARIALAHTRYSNTGSNIEPNFQPMTAQTKFGQIALSHNGNLVNPLILAEKLKEAGFVPKGSSDSELIVLLIALYSETANTLEEAISLTMRDLKGSYSLVILSEQSLIAVRDPWGIRPLSMGSFNHNDTVFASETCALEALGAHFTRDIEPGEIVICDGSSVRSLQGHPMISCRLCVFSFIYVANPGSILYDRQLQTARRHMGENLWKEYPVEIDDREVWVVGPVPDTGIPAAKGYADASGLEVRDIFIKNRYVGRTFIQPDQRLRVLGVRSKLQVLRREVMKKKVVLVEDSIVRATTTGQVVTLLREAGAREVHLRITSPPYRYRCLFGIDTQYSSELIAAKKSVEEIRQYVGADSLGYLSLEGVFAAINKEKYAHPISLENFCTACFTGNYPIDVPDEQGRDVLER